MREPTPPPDAAGDHSIATPRFTLRPVRGADLPALLALCEDSGVRRFLVGPITGPGLADALRAGVAASATAFAARGLGVWAVRKAGASAASALEGVVGFLETYEPPELQLVYGLAPSLRGTDAAGECAAAAVEHALARARPPLGSVAASVEPENAASARVLAKLGFVRAGENREWREDLGGRWAVLDRYEVRRGDAGLPGGRPGRAAVGQGDIAGGHNHAS